MLGLILVALYRAIDIIIWILFIYVLLTWIPNVRWDKQPFVSLRAFAEFLFKPFRFIPPLGILDVSPMVCFLALFAIKYIIARAFMFLT